MNRQVAVWHMLKCSIKLTCINAFYSCYKMPSLHHFLKAYVECIFNWYFINIKSDVYFYFGNKHKKHDKYKHSDIYTYMSYLSLYVFQIVPPHLFFVTSVSLPYLQWNDTYLRISITLIQTSGMRFSSSHFQMKDG